MKMTRGNGLEIIQSPDAPGTVTHPWERLPGESDSAWKLFQAFKDWAYPAGEHGEFRSRNLTQFVREIGLSYGYVANLSSQWRWVQRAGAWDREVDRARAEATLSEVAKVRKRHLRRLAKLGELAETELDKLLGQAEELSRTPMLNPKELLAFMEHVFKAERLVAGEHTDHIKVEGEWDLESLSLEELEQLDNLRRKAGGKG